MPNLKELTCSVEWDSPATPLQEFRTTYGDGYVETFIAVPEVPNPFSIHLQSHGFIAPGLSMFVYMDGVYQCNRNRRNLRVQDGTSQINRTEIDFRVRQKEQLSGDGTFTGRPWHFTKLNFGSSLVLEIRLLLTDFLRIAQDTNDNADGSAPSNGEYIGTIEVVVLRCEAPDRTNKSQSSATKLLVKGKTKVSSKTPPESSKSANVKPIQKSKQKGKAKTKAKRQTFGLDGASDDPDPPDPPNGARTNAQNDPSGNWTMPPAPVGDVKGQGWDNWTMPATTNENSSSKGWNDVGNAPLAEEKPEKGTTEMTSASENVHQPVNGSQALQKGSQNESQAGNHKSRKQRRKARKGRFPPSRNDSQQDPSQQIPNQNGDQGADSVHLRGGGRSTQSVTSRRSGGRDSPLVVNNSIVYNGVGSPPPLSSGPPAARDFWTNMEANNLVNGPRKVNYTKPAAATTPWGELPQPEAKAKVDDWNTGGNGMPGAWDVADNKSGGNDGATSDWNQGEDGAQTNGTDWNNANDQQEANGGGWQGSEEQNDTSVYDNPVHDTNANSWNTEHAGAGPHNEPWNANASNLVQEMSTEEPQVVNTDHEPEVEDTAPAGKGKGKKGRKQRQAKAGKQKGKGSMFDWLNPYAKEESEPLEGPDVSPTYNKSPSPTAANPSSPKSKKEASPKGAETAMAGDDTQAQAQPSFPASSTYEAKPYWSSWRDRATLEETSINDNGLVKAEGLQYTFPSDLIERKKVSHQIRPSIPARYSHKVSRPKYIDSFETPYAVFVFQYRDKDIIEEMLNTSVIESEADEKQRLSSLPKSQLVEELMKAKSQGSSNAASGSHHSSDKATFKSNPFNVPLSPNVSALTQKLSNLESSKAPTPEKVGGWLESASGNGNGNGESAWTIQNTTSPKAKEGSEGKGSQKGSDAGKGNANTSAWNNRSWDNTSQKSDGKNKTDTWDTQAVTDDNNSQENATSSAWNTNTHNNETNPASNNNNDDDAAWGWGNLDPSTIIAAEEPHNDAAAGSAWDVPATNDDHNDNDNDNYANDSTWNNNDNNNDNDNQEENNNTNEENEDTTWGASGFGGQNTSW